MCNLWGWIMVNRKDSDWKLNREQTVLFQCFRTNIWVPEIWIDLMLTLTLQKPAFFWVSGCLTHKQCHFAQAEVMGWLSPKKHAFHWGRQFNKPKFPRKFLHHHHLTCVQDVPQKTARRTKRNPVGRWKFIYRLKVPTNTGGPEGSMFHQQEWMWWLLPSFLEKPTQLLSGWFIQCLSFEVPRPRHMLNRPSKSWLDPGMETLGLTTRTIPTLPHRPALYILFWSVLSPSCYHIVAVNIYSTYMIEIPTLEIGHLWCTFWLFRLWIRYWISQQ